jgi:hypothetical protein
MFVLLCQMNKVIVEDIGQHDALVVKMNNHPNVVTGLVDLLFPSLSSNFFNLAEFI